MSKLNVELLEKDKDENLCGLWKKSNDKSISKDIPDVSQKYYHLMNKKSGEVLPFFVLSKDYNENTKNFDLFIGGLLQKENLESITIPKGLYAKVIVKPKLGFLWGLAVGEAKRDFYTKWLPNNEYIALNMEYEYHTEKSIGKNPYIEIFFAIENK